MSKIYIIGTGPGDQKYLTPQASEAILQSDVVIGYKLYLQLIEGLIKDKQTFSSGMKQETRRAEEAFRLAENGQSIAVVSSGDAGVYGMASLLWEIKMAKGSEVELEVIPGISSMFAAAALMGAPLGHDFCAISLSDLLTPWPTIEKRIKAAAQGDFITALYNPVSHERFWQIMRFRELFLQYRDPQTPVGVARQVGRPDQSVRITTLGELDASMADMLSMVIIGNSQTVAFGQHLITPRGYSQKYGTPKDPKKPGRQIMHASFQQILDQLDSAEELTPEALWVTLYCIHTTADFSIAQNIMVQSGTVSHLHQLFISGKIPVIVTDSNMAAEGIRKGMLEKLGIEVKCYISQPETIQLAEAKNITRAQAGIHLAIKEHPNALYVFGNAPTGLMELIRQVRLGHALPVGIIGAPVGFVNVRESKHMLQFGLPQVPQILITEGRGGSNLAATIVNAIFSWDQAADLNPGEGM
jgi:precorrin-3B C17-methyltransferase